MRVESDYDTGQFSFFGLVQGPSDQGLVTEMHAVEVADGAAGPSGDEAFELIQ